MTGDIGMKTIALENGVKFIVADSIAHSLIEYFNKMYISFKISDTTESDVSKTDYGNAPNLIFDANHLSNQHCS